MFGEIWEYICDAFSSIGEISFSAGDILSSPKFWVSMLMSGGVLYYMLSVWKTKMDQPIMGFYIIGGLAVIAFSYFWTAKDIDQNG